MQTTDDEVLTIFRQTGALLTGHFELRSGRRSAFFFQCARVCERLERVERLAELLLLNIGPLTFETVIAPAMGGLVIGQEVARQSRKRFIFAEKDAASKLILKRGFVFAPGERVLVVEDVITRGGRAQETIDIVKAKGGEPVGLAVLVDRSEGAAQFDVPLTSLLKLSFPTYDRSELPPELNALPHVKPGS